MKWPYSLRSLSHRNLRLFFAGQSVSLVGTWMQSVAQGWLVYRLTHSSELLGLLGFLGQVPAFLFGIWAGSLADRFSRRRMVLATQVNATIQAAILAILTLTGLVQVWHLLVLAWVLGMSTGFEIPARQALLGDIAGENMPNALALNSAIFNSARVVGPAIAGYLVGVLGEGWCFALNALSFAGTIYAVWVMRTPPQPRATASGSEHLLDGLAYAGRTAHVRVLLALLGVTSFFAMPYAQFLPIFAGDVLQGGPRLFGSLQAFAGVGAVIAGVSLLVRKGYRGLARRVGIGASCVGVGLAVLSLSRSAPLSCAGLLLAGFGQVTQTAGTLTLLQGLSPAEMRGRVMGLYSTLFVGLTPFGSLAAGFLARRFTAPHTLLAGAGVVLTASVLFHAALPRLRRVILTEYPTLFPPEVPE